jgi:hypothetical protein
MTRHDDTVRLRHMLDHAREAVAMLAGKERADLQSERMLELAFSSCVLRPASCGRTKLSRWNSLTKV